jgi:hypothetical protein
MAGQQTVQEKIDNPTRREQHVLIHILKVMNINSSMDQILT